MTGKKRQFRINRDIQPDFSTKYMYLHAHERHCTFTKIFAFQKHLVFLLFVFKPISMTTVLQLTQNESEID